MSASALNQLRAPEMSDRLTLNSAGKRRGRLDRTSDANLHVSVMVVGGEGGQGAPRMAASGRLAFVPAAAGGPSWAPATPETGVCRIPTLSHNSDGPPTWRSSAVALGRSADSIFGVARSGAPTREHMRLRTPPFARYRSVGRRPGCQPAPLRSQALPIGRHREECSSVAAARVRMSADGHR
jgi:hypothetical protein